MCDKICSAPKRQLDSLRRRKKKKPPGEKPPSRKIGRFPTRSRRPPPPPPHPSITRLSRLCHRRPFACIFMKSLFRTTIHRDEQRTMTASAAAEMEAARRREKKREPRTAGEEGNPGIPNREGWEKDGWRGGCIGGKTFVRQHAPYSATARSRCSFVRSFGVLCDDCR